jgi:hypothetical protein
VKRLAALAVLGIVVGSVSACNVTPPAATVNGAQISESTFQTQLNRVSSNSDVRCAIGVLADTTIPKQGAGDSTVPMEIADAELTQLIEETLYTQELAHLHSPVTSTLLSYARASMPDLLTPSDGDSPCGLTGGSLVDALPAWFVDQQVTQLADEESLAGVLGHVDLGTSGIEAFYNDNPTDFDEDCLDALATSTKAEAAADEARIKAGASFASVAASSSSNADLGQYGFSTDGSFPCEPEEYLTEDEPDWAAALGSVGNKIGKLAAPFQDSSSVDTNGTGDWLVIEIVHREKQALTSTVALEIQEYLVSRTEDLFSTEQATLLRNAHITVDPEYGSWSLGSKSVLPSVISPAVPKVQYLLNRNVDGATS